MLCDEIGSGTDPHEGTALAFSVLEDLAARGALVLASTHFGLLKAAVHDHPLMVNAAMDYDDRDLKPMFTFRVGDPGTSHAFDIAARMGLPVELLARARTMAGEERVQVEKLLSDLDRRARELADAELRTRVAANEQELLNRQLGERLKGIDKERKETLATLRKEGERALKEGRRELEAAIREIRSRGADQPSVVTARERLAALEERVRVEEEQRASRGLDPGRGREGAHPPPEPDGPRAGGARAEGGGRRRRAAPDPGLRGGAAGWTTRWRSPPRRRPEARRGRRARRPTAVPGPGTARRPRSRRRSTCGASAPRRAGNAWTGSSTGPFPPG